MSHANPQSHVGRTCGLPRWPVPPHALIGSSLSLNLSHSTAATHSYAYLYTHTHTLSHVILEWERGLGRPSIFVAIYITLQLNSQFSCLSLFLSPASAQFPQIKSATASAAATSGYFCFFMNCSCILQFDHGDVFLCWKTTPICKIIWAT